MNDIRQNFLSSLLFAKATKSSKDNIKTNDKTDENLKRLDLNNDGIITKKEAQVNFFDVNSDNKISSQDLGIFTSFISFAKDYSQVDNRVIGAKDFDVDKDGQLDEDEKNMQSLIDSDNDGKLDEYIFDLFFEKQEQDDKFFDSLEEELNILNKKINPNDTSYDRVLDAKTGNVLSQTKIENKDGVETKYSISYEYYEGTKTPKTKTILNENTETQSVRKYNKNGKLIEKTVTENDSDKVSVYSGYVNGRATKLSSTKTVDGKKIATDYDISYEYHKDGDTVRKKTLIKKDTGTVAISEYDKNGKITKKEIISANGDKTFYTYSVGVLNKKVKVAKNGDKTSYLYDENGKVTEKTSYDKSSNETKKYTGFINGNASKMTATKIINGKNVVVNYDISYTYYPGAKTPIEKSVINKTTNVQTICSYDKDGKVTKKAITDRDTGETKVYTDYLNGQPRKLTSTKTQNGKNVTTKYSIPCTFYEGTNKLKTKEIINKNNGTATLYKYDKEGNVTQKQVTKKDQKQVSLYTDYVNGQPTKMTSVKRNNNKEVKTTCSISYAYHSGTNLIKSTKYTNQDTGTISVRKYDTEGNLLKKEITEKDSKKTIYTYNENGKVVQKEIKGKNSGNTTIEYDENGNCIKKEVEKSNSKTTYLYDEKGAINKKIVKTKAETLTYNANDKLIERAETKKDSNGKPIETTYYYDKKGKISSKVIEKEAGTITYNYLKYGKNNYAEVYEVEYDLANGVHTKSKITQKKLEKSNNDYIVSSENYKYINGKAVLISELNTTTKKNSKEQLAEGTQRIFYFYDDNNKLIKKEETFSFNNQEVEGKPLSTNSQYQLNDKIVTTYNPKNNDVVSTVTYDKKSETITTTTYKNGVQSKVKKEKFDNNGYEKHNLNNVTREEFIALIGRNYL